MIDSKLTMDDLYGPSENPQTPTIKDGMVYEETPEIIPIEEPIADVSQSPHAVLPAHEDLKPPIAMKKPRGGLIVRVMVFCVVFVIGLGVSFLVRPYLGDLALSLGSRSDEKKQTEGKPTISLENETLTPGGDIGNETILGGTVTPTPVILSSVGNFTYALVDEQKQPVGVTINLPVTIAKPSCDTTLCTSQGTNLPGGTRFTVAAYTKGPYITDISRARIIDLSGQQFVSEVASISGKVGVKYLGNFRGTTSGGYMFTAMQGVMVRVKDTLTVELNHFTPIGVSTDFDRDTTVFNAIVASLSIAK